MYIRIYMVGHGCVLLVVTATAAVVVGGTKELWMNSLVCGGSPKAWADENRIVLLAFLLGI